MAEATETTDEGAVEAEEGGKKKGGKLFLIMMLPLVLLPMTGGGYLAYSQYAQIAAATDAFSRGADGDGEDGEETVEYGQFVEIENLVINPADANSRYLMVNLGIEVADEEGVAEIEARKIVIRDQILRNLSTRKVAELADVDHREDIIKTDLVNLINEVLAETEVQRLHFTAYVLQ
ncbi:MAG: flagellar basal body-associated FliL family protein [Bacteroidota bacterium]